MWVLMLLSLSSLVGGGGGDPRAVGGGIGHFEADLYLCGGTNGRPLIYYFPDPRKYATPIVVGTSLENNTPHVREYKGFEIQVYSSPLLSAPPPPPPLGEVNDKYIILRLFWYLLHPIYPN